MDGRRRSIGIVTFGFGVNYGCFLQRRALQAVCERLGYRAKAISLFYDDLRGTPSKCLEHRIKRYLKSFCENPFEFLFGARRRKRKAFNRFAKEYLKKTKNFYALESLKAAYPSLGFDACVAGSDQIWTPLGNRFPDFYEYFTLGFAPSEHKIAYAPSVGVSKIADQYAERYRRYLSDFRFLSCRENEGSRELERILNREIPTVLDPTLLLTSRDWDELADKAKSTAATRYIFCYSLGDLEAVLRWAQKLRRTLDRPVLCLEESRKADQTVKRIAGKDAVVVRNAGPCEFINYIKRADCVVTDSYHGAIFSIIYRRPFFLTTRDRNDDETSMNSRIYTLVSTLQLEDRLFAPEREKELTQADLRVDYDAVEKRLKARVDFSINYLKNALDATTGRSNES